MTAADARQPAHEHVRVVIVDSHALVAEAISALVARNGLEVVATLCEWSGLLEHPGMPVDVALLDLHLGDGVLISTKVSELAAQGVATVVVSRRADAASVAAAMHAGARGFVATTDSPDDLIVAIRTVAHGGRHLADHRAEAWRTTSLGPGPGLGRREERAIVLYAAGRSIREVAEAMDTTEETIKSYIKRARRKYRTLGIDVGTRHLLRQHAETQGWMPAD